MFTSGTLRAAIAERTEKALSSGALKPIHTRGIRVFDQGVDFQVRIVSSLQTKAVERRAREALDRSASNPFLPPDPEMSVAGVSDTHLCVLNKYNVIHHHLLIVTRAFEEQEALLTAADFEASLRCMAEFESLAFYNGGRVAGASQPHKHLQLIPLPMDADGPATPLDPLVERAARPGRLFRIPELAFVHAAALLDDTRPASAEALLELYRRMLSETGLNDRFDPAAATTVQSGPYNLLVTRRWMLLVPRSREFFGTISINALAFAGALLVKDEQQLSELRAAGPMAALASTAVAGAPARD